MKRLLLSIAIVAIALLTGCATPIGQGPIATATHNDLRATADYLDSAGLKARAGVFRAVDAQLVACENAINASTGKIPAIVGPIMAVEVANVTLSSGVPAEVRLNCRALPLIHLPGL